MWWILCLTCSVSQSLAEELFYGPAEFLDAYGYGTGTYAGYINPSGYPIRYYSHPVGSPISLLQTRPLTDSYNHYGNYWGNYDNRYGSSYYKTGYNPSYGYQYPYMYLRRGYPFYYTAAQYPTQTYQLAKPQDGYTGILNPVDHGDLVRGYQRSYSGWNPQPVQAVFKNGYPTTTDQSSQATTDWPSHSGRAVTLSKTEEELRGKSERSEKPETPERTEKLERKETEGKTAGTESTITSSEKTTSATTEPESLKTEKPLLIENLPKQELTEMTSSSSSNQKEALERWTTKPETRETTVAAKEPEEIVHFEVPKGDESKGDATYPISPELLAEFKASQNFKDMEFGSSAIRPSEMR